MRATIKTSLILAALLVAVPACGSQSDPKSSLVGEWSGDCGTTKDEDGSKVGDNDDAKLRFTQDGQYSQSIAGPDGGEAEGNYTVAGQTITVTSGGDSVKVDYSIKDGVLTTTTRGKSENVPVTSTCNLRQGSGG
ncbi:MAG: lipocalin family protein [Acidobacteria bacterium]|nr:lipocalin family protein [Acidobacteriota bacterium]